MKTVLSASLVLFASSSMQSAEKGFHRYEYPGYDDTPLIAGYEFCVHDPERPQPPRVAPNRETYTVGTLPYQAHASREPIVFQAHNSPVQYRNIWIRDLE